MDIKYIQKIAEKQSLSLKQVNNIHQLHTEGATIPFMARYRKEATGNLDEVIIGNVIEEIKYFNELEKRKETVLKTIESLGKLTPELSQRIQSSFDATELEDIYLPYKPKRKTRATAALEKGHIFIRKLFTRHLGSAVYRCAAFIHHEDAHRFSKVNTSHQLFRFTSRSSISNRYCFDIILLHQRLQFRNAFFFVVLRRMGIDSGIMHEIPLFIQTNHLATGAKTRI